MKKHKIYVLIGIFIMIGQLVNAQSQNLFTRTKNKGTAIIKQDEAFIQGYNATANLNLLLSAKNNSFIVTTPNGAKWTINKRRQEETNKNGIIWYGEIAGDPGSFVLLSANRTAVTGHITSSKGQMIRITYLGKNAHQVAEINPAKFEEKEIDYIIPDKVQNEGPLPDCPDSPSNIDIMVVYTADAEAGAGGAAGMEALIYECIYRSNLSYENSNINQRLRLVHFARVTYTETADVYLDLDRLKNTSDGFIDNVHTLRNTYAADLVVMLTETMNSYCGLAYYMNTIASSFATSGFGVVKRTCAASNLSFPHEVGHNMGANHNCPNADGGIQYGHFVSTPADGSGQSWRTVMSYNNCTSGACTRIHHFSNPAVSYSPTGSASTNPTGTTGGSCSSDVRTRFNSSASTVANFRCSSPGVNNVWMKDTWTDTGLEPDPNTVGQDMWRSPYIWIRNSQDPTYLHQHDHQNPEFGSDNWIYVKMHNGNFASQTGILQLYYANASISLTWPGSWTLLASVPVTLAANSTKVVEQVWNSLPGTGHYCMLARWVSATDPMAVTEVSDINANTRNNNNIVWRNLNIVNLTPDQEVTVSMDVSNPLKGASQIVFSEKNKFPVRSLTETGKIIIIPDEKLFEIWKKGQSKSTGLKLEGNVFVMVKTNASLDNLSIPAKYKGKITIKFISSKATPSNQFDFSVKQFTFPARGKKKIVGGVDYEIQHFNKG